MTATSFLDAGSLVAIRRAEADGWETELAIEGQVCTILHPTTTRNAVTGYGTVYEADDDHPVRCVVRQRRGGDADRQLGDAVRAVSGLEIPLDAAEAEAAGFGKDDRIRDAAGTEYEVLGVPIRQPGKPSITVAVSVTQ